LKNHGTARGTAAVFPAGRRGNRRVFEESGPPEAALVGKASHLSRRGAVDSPIVRSVPAERRALKEGLLAEPSESEAGDRPDSSECPRCGHVRIFRSGPRQADVGCRGCRRTFSARTGTVRHRSNKDDAAWATSVRLMFEGLTLRKVAERMDVLLRTAFTWRHKLLHAMRG